MANNVSEVDLASIEPGTLMDVGGGGWREVVSVTELDDGSLEVVYRRGEVTRRETFPHGSRARIIDEYVELIPEEPEPEEG